MPQSSLPRLVVYGRLPTARPTIAYTHVVAPSSNFGKNYLPRVGAELDAALITDVVEVG